MEDERTGCIHSDIVFIGYSDDRPVGKSWLASRHRGKEDRRTVFVSITKKGHEILDEVYLQKKEGIVQLFQRLSAEERKTYLYIIEKLVNKLSSVKGGVS